MATDAIRRVDGHELVRLRPWMVPLIQENWGGAPNAGTVENWIRGWQMANDFCFVCSDLAVGLAQVAHDPQDPTPVIEEVFLFCQRGGEAEGVEIYQHWVRWGKSMRASEFRFSRGKGSPMDRLKAAFPNMQHRRSCYVELT